MSEDKKSTKLSRRASGEDSGAAARSGGSVAAAPSPSPDAGWHPFTPEAVLEKIGAASVFTIRLPGEKEIPAVANSFGQILDPQTLHLIPYTPTHFSKTVA
jgi:hypothetical protein